MKNTNAHDIINIEERGLFLQMDKRQIIEKEQKELLKQHLFNMIYELEMK